MQLLCSIASLQAIAFFKLVKYLPLPFNLTKLTTSALHIFRSIHAVQQRHSSTTYSFLITTYDLRLTTYDLA